MKISCSVEIVNHSLSSLNLKSKGKPAFATLSLNHKSTKQDYCEKNVFLIVSTRNAPHGIKYKVYGNVELFTRFVNEGKATVRFKEPPNDIIISKADPLQLKIFMSGVRLILLGKGDGKGWLFSPLRKFERPKQRLSILDRKNYPLKSGFPSTLTTLQVQNCLLKKIDIRVLQLQNLEVLNLTNNCIKELPLSLSNLRLKELILSNNEIGCFPPSLSCGILGQNLQVLDLSNNKIKGLSTKFCLMKKLCVLSLSYNNLITLPRNIACLKSLRMFSASHNLLKFLPFGIRELHLDNLDLFHNPLDEKIILKPHTSCEVVPSLMECSAISVIANSLSFTPDDIPSLLVDYLINRCPCPCGRTVFQTSSFCILLMDLYKLASTVVYVNNSSSRIQVPLKVYFCSVHCWKRRWLKVIGKTAHFEAWIE